MRKKDLLALPLMKVTEEMHRAAEETRVYNYWRSPSIVGPKYQKYYRAKKTDGVLEIAIFTWGRIQAGEEEPAYRIFLHDGKYDTWETEAEKWRTANIEHLWDFYEKTDAERAAYGTYWYREVDRKLIVKFTGSEKQDIQSAVLEWQQYKKHRGETEVIDAAMSLVPDIPKDFEKWALTDALPQYMYYEYGKRIGLCTCCEKHHELKEQPKYGKEGICPGCKRKIQYRTYKKKGRIHDTTDAALIQKIPGGYVLRFFTLHQWIDQGIRRDGGMSEKIRITYNEQWNRQAIYSYHRYKMTNKIRWCNGYEYLSAYGGRKEEERCRLYPRNLRKILKGSKLEYSGMPEFARTGIEFYQQDFINKAKEYAGIEKLIKAGFYNLTNTCISYGNRAPIELYKKRVKKVLGLTGEYYNLIRDKDPTWREYEVTEQCQDVGIRATWEQRQKMSQYARNFAIYMRHSTPHKMLKYIEGLKSEGTCAMRNQEVNDYHDYLQLAAGLGYNLDDDWILYPKNLKERHDQLTEEQNERKVDLEKESDDKKDRKLKRTIKRKGWTRYEMETEELLIRLPECAHEIRKEGNAQHHCVATYMDRMVAGETCILFIRKKEEPDKSYYTVEVRDDEVIQVRGKYNVAPSEDVEEFMKIFKKNLRKVERKAS